MNKILQKYRAIPIAARASLWFLICSFLQKGISVISTPIFTRLMSSSEYGQFGAFNSWYNIIHVVVALNLASGVYTTAMVKFSEDKKVLASSYQGLTLFACVIWLIVYILFSGFWNGIFKLTTVQMLGMFIMVWASAAFALWSVEQRVTYNYKSLVGITVVVSVAKPIIGVLLVINCDDKVTARILGLAAVELIGYSGVAIYQIFRGKELFSKKYWSYALRFNLPLIPHALSQTVLSSADRIMIKNMVGDSQAGYYSLAYNVSLLMVLFNTSLSQTLAPWTYQKLKYNKVEDINAIAIFSIVFVAFINLVLIAAAPELIGIFAPKEYAEAVAIIPPVTMSVYFMFLYDWFCRFEYYYEKTFYILAASMTGAVLNVILNYIFIPIFGYIAAGYTTFFCYAVYCFMHYFFMRRICKTELPGRNVYDIKKIFITSILFIVGGFIISFTYGNRYIRYGVLIILLVVAIVNRNTLISRIKDILLIRKQRNSKTK